MADHVIDTNVLLVASAADPVSPFKDAAHVPVAEQHQVFEWLRAFRRDRSRHLVWDQEVMREYRKKLGKNDYGYLSVMDKIQVQASRVHRIDVDAVGNAVLPEPLQSAVKDGPDRKFVAVVLADGKRSTLVNACDTDWYECEQELRMAGVQVEQLIDGWCRAKHAEKSAR